MEVTIKLPDIRPYLSRSIGEFHVPTALVTASAIALVLALGLLISQISPQVGPA